MQCIRSSKCDVFCYKGFCIIFIIHVYKNNIKEHEYKNSTYYFMATWEVAA